MARSLSLAAYLALARRSGKSVGKQRDSNMAQRPSGELVWAHSTSPETALALCYLAERIVALRPDLNFLITTSFDYELPGNSSSYLHWSFVPEEKIADVVSFLDHWQPDMCLWSKGNLRPALITFAADQDIPLLLLDADVDGFDDARWRWLPDMARAVLGNFGAVLAVNANTAKRLRGLGVNRDRISVTGPIQYGSAALSFSQTDRDELSLAMSGRPVWLAAFAHENEMEIIINAHKTASRLAHRLLLIVVPDGKSDATEIYDKITHSGLRVARWSNGEFPEENIQVLLADTEGEMGLWYRVSPTTFMANSLIAGQTGCDPNAPAALGSAILYGPHIKNHLSSYKRLSDAGGARIVRDAETLGGAVSRLIAPDQAASMAHAAWEVTSQGAQATDIVVDLVLESLDLQGAG